MPHFSLSLLSIPAALIMLDTCKPPANPNRIAVMIRPCILEGSNFAAINQVTGKLSPTNDGLDAFQHAIDEGNAIWAAAADVNMIVPTGPNGSIPVISDPIPPGNVELHNRSGVTDSNMLGDVLQPNEEQETTETLAVADRCNEAWDGIFPDRPGVPVIFAGRFVRLTGSRDASLLGAGPSMVLLYRQNNDALCKRPFTPTAPMVRPRFIVVATNDVNYRAALAHTLAHEFGHALLLNEGDGVDNDGDGPIDLGCDAEADTAQSLMTVNGTGKTLTESQRELARRSALQHVGSLGGPP